MTAEPDALRLVPEHVVDEALALVPVLRSRGRKNSAHDIYRAANLLELLALGASMSAAPAVQPAAGRVSAADIAAVREMIGIEYYAGKDAWAQALERILAALAHPPAQGSESGPTCQKCGGEIHGWCCQSCDAEFRENDSGNLVFDDDAAPVSPDSDLLKEAVWLLREIAALAPPHKSAMLDEALVGTITAGEAREARAFLSKVEERGHD